MLTQTAAALWVARHVCKQITVLELSAVKLYHIL